jgi:hypothetical protein
MNLTLEVVVDNKLMLVTFYKIDALAKHHNGSSIIILGSREYHSEVPYNEMWEKLKKLNYESTLRK